MASCMWDRLRSVADKPIAGKPVANKPIAGKPVADKQRRYWTVTNETSKINVAFGGIFEP